MFIKYTNVVGLQWGDEGKGRIVDYLAKNNDIVARYNGGNNAGHTVKVGDKEFKFHLLPSGALHGKKLYIGHGTIVDPHVLIDEIQKLEDYGMIFTGKLFISKKTNLIVDYHKLLDECREEMFTFGTTKRGIGPAYADKYARLGILAGDLFDIPTLKHKIHVNLKEKNVLFTQLFNKEAISEQVVFDKLMLAKEVLADYICDLHETFYSSYKDKQVSILLEGAQGLMLDVDSTDYPYVTSTHVNPMYHRIGLFDHDNLKVQSHSYNNVGVMKAYATKVGAGNFPSEMDTELGERLRELGKEYGATTGRPRRCGWLDLVQLKKCLSENELTSVVLTKIDVLSNFKTIEVCTEYTAEGKAIYKTLPGWCSDITICKQYKDLPENCRAYIEFIEKELGYKFKIISIGPERSQLLEK